jgi:acetyl esterase
MPVETYFAELFDKIEDIDLAKFFADPEVQGRYFGAFVPPTSYRAPEASTEDRAIAGPHGDIPVRIYRPLSGTPSGEGVVWAHDGGWGYGTIDDPGSDCFARELVARTGGIVVTLAYQLVSETVKFPVPLDEYEAVFTWTHDHAAELGIDPTRLMLGGGGCAASMSLGATLKLKDAGKPLPAGLILPFPLTHLVVPAPTDDHAAKVAVIPPMLNYDASMVAFMYQGYFGDPSSSPSPYATPADGDLSGLPRTLVITSEYDALAPDGVHLAELLGDAGVDVTFLEESGAAHAHLNYPWTDASRRSLATITEWLDDESTHPLGR